VFRIVRVAVADGQPPAAYRAQTVEVALGPSPTFPTGRVGTLTRRARADRVVSGAPHGRGKPKRPRETKTPRVVELLRKAHTWREPLDSGQVANRAEIARREGVTRTRVTQVLRLLRLTPQIREHILSMPGAVRRAAVTEHALRPIAQIGDRKRQLAEFQDLVVAETS
jgi:hypothetical protein